MTAEALVPAVEVGLVAVAGVKTGVPSPAGPPRDPPAGHPAPTGSVHTSRSRGRCPSPTGRSGTAPSATDAPDEALAAELEEAGARAQRRGGVGAAQAALERAARLSADPAQRVRRYLRAAELAFEWGRPDVVDRLLHETAALDVPAREQTRMTVIRARSEEGIQGESIRRLTEVAAAAAADGRTDQTLLFLRAASLQVTWADASAPTRARVLEVVEQTLDPDDAFTLEVIAQTAPIDRGAVVIERLGALSSRPLDPAQMRSAGHAASVVGDLPLSVKLFTSALPSLRADGRLGDLCRILMVQAWDALNIGRFDLAATAADEAARLAADTEQPLVRAIALVGPVDGVRDPPCGGRRRTPGRGVPARDAVQLQWSSGGGAVRPRRCCAQPGTAPGGLGRARPAHRPHRPRLPPCGAQLRGRRPRGVRLCRADTGRRSSR